MSNRGPIHDLLPGWEPWRLEDQEDVRYGGCDGREQWVAGNTGVGVVHTSSKIASTNDDALNDESRRVK